MKPITLVALAVVALALGAYVWWGGGRGPADGDAGSRRVLAELDRASVARIRITPKGRSEIELRRANGAWRIVRPVAAKADAAVVDRLLSAAEFLERERDVPAATASAELGLQPAQAKVTLDVTAGRGAANTATVLDFGNVDASGEGTYVAFADQRFVITKSAAQALQPDVSALRDRDLLHVTPDRITRIRVEHTAKSGARAWILTRVDQAWQIEAAGLASRAKRQGAGRVAATLAGIRATRFIAGKPPAGRTTIAVTIRDRTSGKAAPTRELVIGDACPGWTQERLAAVRTGRGWDVVCIDKQDAEQLEVAGATLRDLHLITLAAADLAGFSVDGARGKKSRGSRGAGAKTSEDALTVKRDGSRWRMDGGTQADGDEVTRWLRDLAAMSGTLAPSTGIGTPDVRIELRPERGAVRRLACRHADDGVRCQRDDERAVLVLPIAVLPRLAATRLDFRRRQLRRIARHEVASITATTGKIRVRIERAEPSGFSLVEPRRQAIAASVIDPLLESLADLRAHRFTSRAAPPLAGATRVEVSLQKPAPLEKGARPAISRFSFDVDLSTADITGIPCAARVSGEPALQLHARDCDRLRTIVALATRAP